MTFCSNMKGLVSALGILSLAVSAVACSKSDTSNAKKGGETYLPGSSDNANGAGGGGGGGSNGGGGGGGGSNPGQPGATPDNGNRVVTGSGFLVKEAPLLSKSIESCMGPKLTIITADMIRVAGGAAPAADKVRFLGQNFTAGQDIIDVLKGQLYDPSLLERNETMANSLTIDYINALATVADVVAHNCDPKAANSLCDCSSADKAKAMISRCLPQLAPDKQDKAAASLAASCTVGKPQRDAVAGLINSAVFAQLN